MDLYITHHALERAKQRLGFTSKRRVLDEALTAMIYGRRFDDCRFRYCGYVWCFNQRLDTLKTVYAG